jgi:hypothetical protein
MSFWDKLKKMSKIANITAIKKTKPTIGTEAPITEAPITKEQIDRKFFFSEIKKQRLFTSLTSSQVKGMEALIDAWEKSGLKDIRWFAYMLATTYHETARTMLPIAEYGKGRGRPYGQKIKMNRSRYTSPNQIYYGRGYVQLTWYENYDKMGKLLGIDLLNNPELAMDKDVASDIMIEGMVKGLFTGRSLKTFFNESKDDPKQARRIINGMDKATTIATYHNKFLKALQ